MARCQTTFISSSGEPPGALKRKRLPHSWKLFLGLFLPRLERRNLKAAVFLRMSPNSTDTRSALRRLLFLARVVFLIIRLCYATTIMSKTEESPDLTADYNNDQSRYLVSLLKDEIVGTEVLQKLFGHGLFVIPGPSNSPDILSVAGTYTVMVVAWESEDEAWDEVVVKDATPYIHVPTMTFGWMVPGSSALYENSYRPCNPPHFMDGAVVGIFVNSFKELS